MHTISHEVRITENITIRSNYEEFSPEKMCWWNNAGYVDKGFTSHGKWGVEFQKKKYECLSMWEHVIARNNITYFHMISVFFDSWNKEDTILSQYSGYISGLSPNVLFVMHCANFSFAFWDNSDPIPNELRDHLGDKYSTWIRTCKESNRQQLFTHISAHNLRILL